VGRFKYKIFLENIFEIVVAVNQKETIK